MDAQRDQEPGTTAGELAREGDNSENRVHEEEPQQGEAGVGTAGVGEGGPLVTGQSEASSGSSLGEQPDQER